MSLAFRFLALTESSAGVISEMQSATLVCGSAVSFFENASSFAWTAFPVYSFGPAAASCGGSASFAFGMAALSCKPLKLQESGQVTVQNLDQHIVHNFSMFPLCFVLTVSTALKLLTQLQLYLLMKLQPLQHSFCQPVTMAETLEP